MDIRNDRYVGLSYSEVVKEFRREINEKGSDAGCMFIPSRYAIFDIFRRKIDNIRLNKSVKLRLIEGGCIRTDDMGDLLATVVANVGRNTNSCRMCSEYKRLVWEELMVLGYMWED